MIPTNLEVAVQNDFRYRGLAVYIDDPKARAVATSLTMKAVEPHSCEYIEPLFVLDAHRSQKLMDDLWTAGIRPTEGSGSAGSLAATERHLADMRKLVASKLGVEL